MLKHGHNGWHFADDILKIIFLNKIVHFIRFIFLNKNVNILKCIFLNENMYIFMQISQELTWQ